MRRDELEERTAVPGADRQPADRAEQHTVEDQHGGRAEPGEDAGGEREQRDADVVRHDLRPRTRPRSSVERPRSCPSGARLASRSGTRRARGPTRPPGRRAPRRRERSAGAEEERRRDREQQPPFRDEAPVAVRDEPERARRGATGRRTRASAPARRPVRAGRRPGRRGRRGARARDRRRPRGRGSPSSSTPSGPSDSGRRSRRPARALSSRLQAPFRSRTKASKFTRCGTTTRSRSATPEGVDLRAHASRGRFALRLGARRPRHPGAAARRGGGGRRPDRRLRRRRSVAIVTFVVVLGYDILFEVLRVGPDAGEAPERPARRPLRRRAGRVPHERDPQHPPARRLPAVRLRDRRERRSSLTRKNQRLGDLAAGTLVVRDACRRRQVAQQRGAGRADETARVGHERGHRGGDRRRPPLPRAAHEIEHEARRRARADARGAVAAEGRGRRRTGSTPSASSTLLVAAKAHAGRRRR